MIKYIMPLAFFATSAFALPYHEAPLSTTVNKVNQIHDVRTTLYSDQDDNQLKKGQIKDEKDSKKADWCISCFVFPQD